MTTPNLKRVTLDGIEIGKVQCPRCEVWQYIDEDQYHGVKPMYCAHQCCGFYVGTHNFFAEDLKPMVEK